MTRTPRRAFVTGVTGQDGSLLAEFLLGQGYSVVGLTRSGADHSEMTLAESVRDHVELIAGDLLDPATLTDAVQSAGPDEIYHLASPSFVPDSWVHPQRTCAAIVGATAALLEAVRDRRPRARLFIASSSEMFGDTLESPQSEDTVCRPRTPYGTAKLAAHQLAGQFRRHDHVFACSGILYNHESERRPERFVTRRITRAAAAISLGLESELVLGDIGGVRDWSYAGDIVRGAWMMLQNDEPNDYVLASGAGRTVREFLDAAFALVGLNADEHVRIDPALVRPGEHTPLVGDPSRARRELGWQPSVAFTELVRRMVQADLDDLRRTPAL